MRVSEGVRSKCGSGGGNHAILIRWPLLRTDRCAFHDFAFRLLALRDPQGGLWQNPKCFEGDRKLELLRLTALFALTALAEIVGCYLPWLVIKQEGSLWLLVPAAVSLALFAWLLTLHPTAAGRTYASYGGMYIVAALIWLRVVDGVPLTRWDVSGAALALAGMAVIALQPS